MMSDEHIPSIPLDELTLPAWAEGSDEREIIETLEMYLAQARRGQLRGIAIAAVRREGHGTSSMTSYDGRDCWAALLGAVTYLLHRLAGAKD